MEYRVVKDSNELSHHGILGQKWGVRRYQNADGTWTDAGKKRYGKEIERDLKKQNREMLKDWHKNGTGSYHNERLYKNTHALRNQINNELKNSKEYDSYVKAENKYHKAEERHNYREEHDSKYDSLKGTRKLESLYDKMNDTKGAYLKKISETYKQHEGDFLGAKLKDIGHKDTEVGRKIVRDLLADDDSFFISDTNKFKKK